MNLIESLEWRYATKRMNGEQIPEEKMNHILDAVQLAPSSYGLTPYTVIVVQDPAVKEKVTDTLAKPKSVVVSTVIR